MSELSIYWKSYLLHTQEVISKYHHGGYHPVSIGDTLKDSHYKIHHKLGYGGFSTVWLARDRVYAGLEILLHRCTMLTCHSYHRWVSIKVTVANSLESSKELKNIRSLIERTKANPASQSISQLLDAFIHHGPNGAHQCLVFELLGPTLTTVLQFYSEDNEELLTETVLKISKQLLRAIAMIHQAGFAHGGMFPVTICYLPTYSILLGCSFSLDLRLVDLSISNVAFSSHRLSKMTEGELFKVIGTLITEKLARVDGKPLGKGLPGQLVKTASWVGWDDEDDEDLRIFDFGQAFRLGAEPPELAQPRNLRVPETIFTNQFDYRVDLWCAGLMVRARPWSSPKRISLTISRADLRICVQSQPVCVPWR